MGTDVARPATEWTDDDVRGTGRAAGMWWELLVAGVEPPPDGLDAAGERVAQLAASLGSAPAPGEQAEPGARAERADQADTLLTLLSTAGRAVHEAGYGPALATATTAATAATPATVATVEGVFASGGGVPKQPVAAADVGWRGLAGDRQAARRHHGRVWQALCVWSADVVDRLAAEGHPIHYGAAGENVSVRGVDWAALRPGTRLRLGTALAEVTVPALPCAKNARWFVDGDFNRMHHERDRSVTRWYALVVEPGRVAPGDPVVVEPGHG